MSLWDIHRTQTPWIALTDPHRAGDIAASLVAMGRDGEDSIAPLPTLTPLSPHSHTTLTPLSLHSLPLSLHSHSTLSHSLPLSLHSLPLSPTRS
jgi:hypothetical protein